MGKERTLNKLLLVGLAGAAAGAASTPAQAHPTFHYRGGCAFMTISDGTDSPQTQWEGEVHAAGVATDAVTGAPAPAVSITIDCELRINGATPGAVVFSVSGTGTAGGAGLFSFNADPDDIVTMCENVTVGGEFHKDCADATTTPIVPEPVSALIDEAEYVVDGAACPVIAAQAGGLADQPPAFDIRDDGDIYVHGEWFWDCPPYDSSGS